MLTIDIQTTRVFCETFQFNTFTKEICEFIKVWRTMFFLTNVNIKHQTYILEFDLQLRISTSNLAFPHLYIVQICVLFQGRHLLLSVFLNVYNRVAFSNGRIPKGSFHLKMLLDYTRLE